MLNSSSWTGNIPIASGGWSEKETEADLWNRLYPPLLAKDDPATWEYVKKER